MRGFQFRLKVASRIAISMCYYFNLHFLFSSSVDGHNNSLYRGMATIWTQPNRKRAQPYHKLMGMSGGVWYGTSMYRIPRSTKLNACHSKIFIKNLPYQKVIWCWMRARKGHRAITNSILFRTSSTTRWTHSATRTVRAYTQRGTWWQSHDSIDTET